jgi:hypothetical protein
MRLVTDEDDAPVEAFLPQRLGRPAPGQAGSDDDDRSQRGSVLDGDGLLGAAPDRFLHLRTHLLRRVLVQDVQEVVVADLEHLGGDAHAHRVALTQVEVDDDLHPLLQQSGSIAR